MVMQDFIGYTLTCCMSTDFKNEPNYSDAEFDVVFYEDSDSDSGYSATVSGTNLDGEFTSDTWDGEVIAKNIIFGSWVVKKQTKIR